MTRVAIIGAGGLIGLRAVEMWHLTHAFDVVAVVRSRAARAALTRFDMPVRIADARLQEELEPALAGCDVVVHSAATDLAGIVPSAAATYRAAAATGCRALVYISSASVHGLEPSPSTTIDTALVANHGFRYCNERVDAEAELTELQRDDALPVTVLRPSIVTGPRSQWVVGHAERLLAGTERLLDGGIGSINAIHVDNLVTCIRAAIERDDGAGATFTVRDQDPATWAEFYGPLAAGLGYDVAALPPGRPSPAPPFVAPARTRPALRPLRTIAGRIGRKAPLVVRGAFWGAIHAHRGVEVEAATIPDLIDPELSALYRNRWRYPIDQTTALVGDRPLIDHDEGVHRTLRWLHHVGYPTT